MPNAAATRAIPTRRREYGIRAVIHPHAGGYIEFGGEIRRLLADIPYETAGLCLDTGTSTTRAWIP